MANEVSGVSDDGSANAHEVQAILAAAEEELTLLGLRRSSVDEMARKAGVSRSTLYRRFKDKEHLVVAVVNKVGDDAVTELEAAVSGCGPEEAVVAAFCTYVHILNTRKILRRLLIGESALPHELVRILERRLTELLVSHLAALLKEAGSTKPDEELLIISELLFKISFAYLGRNPSRFVSFDDPAAVRAFATDHLAVLISENRG